jgi:hypothetical protein
MVDAMTDTPLRNIPNSGAGWNGGTRFRKIADTETSTEPSTDGLFIPKARSGKNSKIELADADLVPVNQLGGSSESDPALENKAASAKPKIKNVSQSETAVADHRDPETPSVRSGVSSKSKSDRQPPRVRLMPVQDLEKSNEGTWRGNAKSSSME